MMTTDFERWTVRGIALVGALGLLSVGCAQTSRPRGLTVVADTGSMTSVAGGSAATPVPATAAIPSAPAALPAVTVFDAFAVPNSPATIWAVTSRGRLEHSNDAAASWTDVTPFAAGQILVNQQFVNPSSAWVLSELRGNDVTPAAAVFLWHTKDGGTTWNSSTLNTQAPARAFVSFVDEMTGWIGIGLAGRDAVGIGGSWLYRTTDGGATFRAMGGASGSDTGYSPIGAMTWLDATHGFGVNERDDPNLFQTTDAGASWSIVKLPNADQALCPVSIGVPTMRGSTLLVPYAFQDDQGITTLIVYSSTDEGATFTQSGSLTDSALGTSSQFFDLPINFLDSAHWILDGSKKGHYTDDAGRTWSGLSAVPNVDGLVNASFASASFGVATYARTSCVPGTNTLGRPVGPCTTAFGTAITGDGGMTWKLSAVSQ